ncbi:MAG: hypothetical protein WD018_07605 [Nitrosopumilaceae archaeon]
MNKKLISVLATILLLGTLTGVSEAKSGTPFGYTSTGVDIVDFELDFKDIEVILDVQVTEISATLEITFEREFFDSTNLDQDSEFTIIADGDLVYYDEIVTNSKLRTLKFNLSSDVELVEIFGTHLKGIIAQSPIIEVTEEIPTKVEQTGKINELIEENQVLREENNILKEENEKLDGRIFELENLVSALEVQVTNLNTIVTEQIKVIYNWVLGYSIN